jgi:hypothetical protein
MIKRQWMWRSLAPLTASAVLLVMAGTGSGFAQTTTQTPTAQTPTPTAQTPTAQTPTAQPSPATVVTDSVNLPVQVRTAMRGIPVVNTQQILHKSSLDPQEASTPDATASVRLLNNLDLNTVGVRMDLNATSWATTPGSTSAQRQRRHQQRHHQRHRAPRERRLARH